jgi:hypothetical protein
MSRIPSFPFRVIVIKKAVGNAQPQSETHNYAELAGAIVYRDTALRRPNTKRVEIHCVLDESTPGYKD